MGHYEEKSVELEKKAKEMGLALVGKKVIRAEMPISWPSHYTSVTLVMEDGTKLEVSTGLGVGCSECDPYGIGWGVDVNVMERK